VITGFKEVAAGTLIKIWGKIDMPDASGPFDNDASISSYCKYVEPDIYSNGNVIDRINPEPLLTLTILDDKSMRLEESSDLYLESKLLRAGHKGPLYMHV